MLTKDTLHGFAITMFVTGISMIFFPEFHNKGTKLNFGMPDTIYVGVFFTFIGGIILLIKLYTWYDSKKSGDNDNKRKE
jgi:hypothetical protein